jgi:hypothetical protein
VKRRLIAKIEKVYEYAGTWVAIRIVGDAVLVVRHTGFRPAFFDVNAAGALFPLILGGTEKPSRRRLFA